MRRVFATTAVSLALLASFAGPGTAQQPAKAETPPAFQPEPFWPKPLPEGWILGQVAGIATAPNGNVWILHRPASLLDDEKGLTKNPPEYKCCKAAPPVMEFDVDGNLLRHWGGPNAEQNWVKNEHGLHIDKEGNVWVGGNNDGDQLLHFTPDGKFINQVGKDDGTKGPRSGDTARLNRPAHMFTDDAANEIYVADGYGNRRVIVFDSKTGAYKRHWGAYGNPPNDDKLPPYSPTGELSKQFSNPVHCVRVSNDGLVYVCDRANDRIQVFRTDGTFVKEFRVEPSTLSNGSVWDLVLSEDKDQRFIFVADGANGQVSTLSRETGEMLGQWGRHGRQPGQFKWIHNIAIDQKGNLYTAEVGFGRRVQKFKRTN
ncbi:MAG: hypothetical protein WCE79_28700 [Xanthobacteraceae bacterium]